jgi:hypothetical protein
MRSHTGFRIWELYGQSGRWVSDQASGAMERSNLGNGMQSQSKSKKNMSARMSKPKIFQLIQSYQQWIQDYIDKGWRPYQVSFMFHQLPGSQLSILAQMKQEICRVYSRLITRFDRNPRSPASFSRLPRLILFPDFPVYKRGKTSIRGISINNGLHYQGIALRPPVSRFRSTLDEHFRQDQHKYINDKLARIAVQPITWDPD